MGGQVCEVTEGCSGIRSIQSLVMAALFFGELLWLRWPGRVLLVLVALAAAVVCNTGRAWYLASVQFSEGGDAAHAAHDPAGHLAFLVAAAVLFAGAWLLMPRVRGKQIVRRIVAPEG
jgi:exosortase/archaeosortase family protein